MRRVQILAALALAAALGVPLGAETAQPSGALAGGIDHFQAGRYDDAIAAFSGIASAADDPQQPAASFWLAKTQLAVGRIDEAAVALAHYLATWPKAADRAEAVYLQGRILHQQEDFEAALQVFQAFLEGTPSSPFSANAWFWSAESLFGLGRLEEASVLYQKVVREYPTSAKVEAAEYKASLIKLTQREQELSRLLKWSHEEFLRTVEEYQRRQDSSDRAIAALQQRLAGTGTGASAATAPAAASTAAADTAIADLRAELERTTAESAKLAGQVSDLETQLEAAKAAAKGTESESSDAAAQAAAVYDQALAELRTELEAKTAEASDLEARIAELERRLEAADEAAAAAEASAAAAVEAASARSFDLEAQIVELESRLADSSEASGAAEASSAAGAAEKERLLAAKADALALKELLLEWLEEQEVQP